MRFLKMLFWVAVAVFLAIFASRNWHNVTVNLWGDLQADIKLPILLALMVLLGFLPTWLVMRGRLWQLRRRVGSHERQRQLAAQEAQPEPEADADEEAQ
jgi:putative membrane protein